jgi:hypothetical protein
MPEPVVRVPRFRTWYFCHAPQMKGPWESNKNVCFPFMSSQKWNCYFQNRIIMFCLPVPTLIYLWEIYIFQGLVYLFCSRKILVGRSWAYINRSQTHECGNWDWEAAQFPEKKYINGIFVAVWSLNPCSTEIRGLEADLWIPFVGSSRWTIKTVRWQKLFVTIAQMQQVELTPLITALLYSQTYSTVA